MCFELRSILALNPVQAALHAGLEVGGIGFIRVDVHGEPKARVHANAHIAKDEFAVAWHAHTDRDTIPVGAPGSRNDVTQQSR